MGILGRSALGLWIAAFVVAVCSGTAWAEQPAAADVGRMGELKASGDAAMESLRYADALAAYEQAYAASPSPALLYNQGRALQALGRYPEALDRLEAFSQIASPQVKALVPKLASLIAEVQARVTRLSVETSVAGARVLVRNQLVGRTPLATAVRVTAGVAVVEVIAEGYRPFRKSVVLPGGGELTVTAELTARDVRAVLMVKANVVGASVAVDGKQVGTVPVELVVAPGVHRIVVSRSGWEDSATSAVVRPSERKLVSTTLVEVPPVTARWWFWTGVGAAVVGGTILVVALVSDAPADSGDIPPGQLGAPLVRFP